MFEDTKGVIIRNSHGIMKNNKRHRIEAATRRRTNRQTVEQWPTEDYKESYKLSNANPAKTGEELRFSSMASNSWSTSGTRCVTIVKIMNEETVRLLL